MFFMRFQMCYNNIHKALGDIFMSHISLEVNHKHFRDLYLCFCGIHDCEPSHSFGPAIRPNYLLHFVIKGKGNYASSLDTTFEITTVNMDTDGDGKPDVNVDIDGDGKPDINIDIDGDG